MDQSKKTMRHFYCRDVLWETFEQMANDFDCSIDYLINEAMRYYARSKNYQSAGGAHSQAPAGAPGNASPNAGASSPGASGSGAGAPAGRRGVASTSPPTRPPPVRPGPTPGPPQIGGGMAMGGQGGMPTAPQGARSSVPPMAPVAVPAPPGGYGGPPAGPNGPTLYLLYNGQRFPVVKDQFIIGRGSKTSDLAIKDGNISRKHAAVIRRNGTYYIKDLGSTNGIDYKGMRIDNKRIDEGDIFHLCDYELRFTYRGD